MMTIFRFFAYQGEKMNKYLFNKYILITGGSTRNIFRIIFIAVKPDDCQSSWQIENQ